MKVPLTLLMGLASGVAAADSNTPVFGQIVAFTLPGGFVAGFESTAATNYIQEFVPHGESVEQWSQMITLTGAKDQARDPASAPMQFAGKIAQQYSKACPKTFSSQVVGTLQISGHDAVVALLGCGSVRSVTPRSEVAMVVAIKGKSDMYTIQWAERSAPMEQAPPLDNVKWGSRFQQLNRIRICDLAGEGPPSACIGGATSP